MQYITKTKRVVFQRRSLEFRSTETNLTSAHTFGTSNAHEHPKHIYLFSWIKVNSSLCLTNLCLLNLMKCLTHVG